jgi:hypothetical protein
MSLPSSGFKINASKKAADRKQRKPRKEKHRLCKLGVNFQASSGGMAELFMVTATIIPDIVRPTYKTVVAK